MSMMTCIFSIGSSFSFFLFFSLFTTRKYISQQNIWPFLSFFLSLFFHFAANQQYHITLLFTQLTPGIIYMPWTTLATRSTHCVDPCNTPYILADSSWSWFWLKSTWHIPILSHLHRHLGIQPNKTTQCPEKGNVPRSSWSWVYHGKRK